jgi:hypothetical protein
MDRIKTTGNAIRSICLLVVLTAILTPLLTYQGVLYQTGAEYYHVCWQSQHANEGPSTPEQAAQWTACQPTAEKAVYDAGFVFAGNPENALTPALKALQQACPSAWGDPYLLAMGMLEENGGPNFMDHMLPAPWSITRRFESKWPKCVAIARATGIPPLTRQAGGEWAFSAPCVPCQDEEKAKQQHKAEQDKWDALTEQQRQQKLDEALNDLAQQKQ